jgi:urease accessory protein
MKPIPHRIVPQTSQSAVLQVSKAVRRGSLQTRELDASAGPADLEIGDTAGLETCATNRQSWLVWQLADSAFPTGGFAHSSGLEAAWQQGEVRNRADLVSYLKAALNQLRSAVLPFVVATWTDPDRCCECDALCDVFTTNHVANRASRAQGRAFLSAVERIFGDPAVQSGAAPEFAHFAPVFGACLRRLDVDQASALRLFVFGHLRSVIAAAVRLNIVGPMEAQRIQHRLTDSAEAVVQRCGMLTLADLAQTAPLLDLWQGAQDRLYSRLLQS